MSTIKNDPLEYHCKHRCSKYKHCIICGTQLCIEFSGGCVDIPAHVMDGHICTKCFERMNDE